MTFRQLGARLADPIILGGLILAVLGEVQAQSDVLLSWLTPTAAGRVLSLIGILGMVIRWVQALSATPADEDRNDQAGFARPLMLAALLAISVPAAVMLPACTTLGLAPASTISQRVAQGYGVHTAVLVATRQSLEAGDIDAGDAQRVLTVADQARTALDAARLASTAGDPVTAEGRLQLAVSLLSELQNYLRTHQ